MKIYIGDDSLAPRAAATALKSLRAVSDNRHEVEFLDTVKLRAQGLYTRETETRDGQLWDVVSDAPMSTEFAITRFLVPILARGMALYVDGDVVFREDPANMLRSAQSNLGAVAVVKHDYEPGGAFKMDGRVQSKYWRKNWSSVMLFNCEHPSHRRLTLEVVNRQPGRALHQFAWLDDHEITTLDPRWNWLVGEQPEPAPGGIAHFTLGGPFTRGWAGGPHDDIWNEAAR